MAKPEPPHNQLNGFSQPNGFRRGFLLICGLAFLAMYQFLLVPRAPLPVRVQPIAWKLEESKGFLPGAEKPASMESLLGIDSSALFDTSYTHRRFLVAEPLIPGSPFIELEVAGEFANLRLPVPEVELLDENGRPIFSEPLPLRSRPPTTSSWTSYAVQIPSSIPVDAAVRLRIVVPPRKGASDMIAIRGRIAAFEPPTLRERTFLALNAKPLARKAVTFLVAALALLCLVPLVIRSFSAGSVSRVLLLLLLLSAGFHFRGASFFHWDEWHVLARFQEHGWSSVLLRHNEHFLPLFFALYFLETKILGPCYSLYLLVSLLVQAANSLLIMLIMERLIPQAHSRAKAAAALGVAFAVSALHSESLHWAFEICLLLCETLTFSLLLVFLKRVSKERWDYRPLVILASGTALVPLLFGSGFVFPAVLAAFSLFMARQSGRDSGVASPRGVMQLTLPVIAAGIGLMIPAAGYLLFREGAGHGVEQAKLFSNIPESLRYLFVGTQLGSILRGLGFYPSLELAIDKHVPQLLLGGWMSPEMLLASCGFLLSLAVFPLCGVRRALPFWLLGQSYLILFLFLPALGRWQLGVDQSLALRYHSQMLPGLLILLLPIFAAYWGRVLFAFLVIWLGIQAVMGAELRYFTDSGRLVRRAVAEAKVGGTAALAAAEPNPLAPGMLVEHAVELLRGLKRREKLP